MCKVSNERASYVFNYMPLKIACAYEHQYYAMEGYRCKVVALQESVEDLLRI